MIDFGLYFSYILLAISMIAAIVFPVYFMIIDFKKAKGTLLSFVLLVAVYLVCYLISSSEVYEKFKVGTTLSKHIGGGLIMSYIFIFAPFIIIAIFPLIRLFRK